MVSLDAVWKEMVSEKDQMINSTSYGQISMNVSYNRISWRPKLGEGDLETLYIDFSYSINLVRRYLKQTVHYLVCEIARISPCLGRS